MEKFFRNLILKEIIIPIEVQKKIHKGAASGFPQHLCFKKAHQKPSAVKKPFNSFSRP